MSFDPHIALEIARQMPAEILQQALNEKQEPKRATENEMQVEYFKSELIRKGILVKKSQTAERHKIK